MLSLFLIPCSGDVAGSVEVLESLLTKHQPHEFQFKIISSGVGNVTEADIELAHGTQGTTHRQLDLQLLATTCSNMCL